MDNDRFDGHGNGIRGLWSKWQEFIARYEGTRLESVIDWTLSMVSALLSVLVYWWAFGLGITGALIFVGLLFVHEMGHVIVGRYYGIPASVPIFIPFLGAVISWKKLPRNAYEEAMSAIAGPLAGTLGALSCLGIYVQNQSKVWLWGAAIGFLFNLFNLVPVSPLDGGRVVGAVWRGLWFLGLVVLAFLGFITHSWVIFLALMLGMIEIERRFQRLSMLVWFGLTMLLGVLFLITEDWFFALLLGFSAWNTMRRKHEKPVEDHSDATESDSAEDYFNIPLKSRVVISALYLGLAAALGWLIYWVVPLNPFS